MSTTTNENRRDELRLMDIEEAKRALNRLGWSSENLNAMLDAGNLWHDLLERRWRFAQAREAATGHVEMVYDEEIGQIDEVLAAPVLLRIRYLEAEIAEAERQAENFETRDGFDGTKEKLEAKIGEMREELDDLRESLEGTAFEGVDAEALSTDAGPTEQGSNRGLGSGNWTSGDFERPTGTAGKTKWSDG